MAAAACTVALIRTQRKARSLREGRREGQRRPAPILEPVQIDPVVARPHPRRRPRTFPIARIDAARVGPVSHLDQHGSAQGFQRRIDEDELSYDNAFSRVALDILGYDADAGVSSDGRGDHGVDYWIVDERAATIFQFAKRQPSQTPSPANRWA